MIIRKRTTPFITMETSVWHSTEQSSHVLPRPHTTTRARLTVGEDEDEERGYRREGVVRVAPDITRCTHTEIHKHTTTQAEPVPYLTNTNIRTWCQQQRKRLGGVRGQLNICLSRDIRGAILSETLPHTCNTPTYVPTLHTHR